MIDFDKAEFLARLDVRFAAFSALLEMHEKYIISLCESNKVFKDATKSVERHHRELYDFINKTDKKIYDFFEKAKSEADKQQTSTADVVEVRHGERIDKPTGAYSRMQSWCSACGKHSGVGGIESNRHKPYCPNCGAKMCD